MALGSETCLAPHYIAKHESVTRTVEVVILLTIQSAIVLVSETESSSCASSIGFAPVLCRGERLSSG